MKKTASHAWLWILVTLAGAMAIYGLSDLGISPAKTAVSWTENQAYGHGYLDSVDEWVVNDLQPAIAKMNTPRPAPQPVTRTAGIKKPVAKKKGR